jgi:hypothetical protein
VPAQVAGPRYWSLTIDPQHAVHRSVLDGLVVYVKRKTGHLPYEQDPRGLRSIVSRTFPKSIAVTAAEVTRSPALRSAPCAAPH